VGKNYPILTKYIITNRLYNNSWKKTRKLFEKTLAIFFEFCYYNRVTKEIMPFKEVQTHGKM